jgi:CRP-like cAMP-binding protein
VAKLASDEDAWIAHIARRADTSGRTERGTGVDGMDPVDKVLFLEQVDILREVRSTHLAYVASIAEEVEKHAGEVLLREGEPVPALFIVIEGTVELQGQVGTMTAERGAALGAWSLVDEAPGIVTAKAVDTVRLLRIGREDFYDLLTDYPEFAIALMQGLARRMRGLVA